MGSDQTNNHGEGNPEAAARFNEAERTFVSSPKGAAVIKAGPKVSPQEQAELDEAEREGRARAKGESPAAEADTLKRP
jgi:hypothetical protein